MVVRYGKKVKIVEVGMSRDKATATTYFLEDLITKTKYVSGGKALGVLCQEP